MFVKKNATKTPNGLNRHWWGHQIEPGQLFPLVSSLLKCNFLCPFLEELLHFFCPITHNRFLAFSSHYCHTEWLARLWTFGFSRFNLFMDSLERPLGHFDVTTLTALGRLSQARTKKSRRIWLPASNIWNTRLAVNRQMHTHTHTHSYTYMNAGLMGKGLGLLWDLLMWNKQMNESKLTVTVCTASDNVGSFGHIGSLLVRCMNFQRCHGNTFTLPLM